MFRDGTEKVLATMDLETYGIFCAGIQGTDHRLIHDGKRFYGDFGWVTELDQPAA